MNDELSNYKGQSGLAERWFKELDLVEDSKAEQSYQKIGKRIVKTYRNAAALGTGGSDTPRKVMFNILWSNVQILKPCLYSRMPKVVVERRFKDSDPIGRLAGQIAERAISYMLSKQQDRFNYAMKAAVEDRLLPGRGQVWLSYSADFEEAKDEQGNPIVENNIAVKTPKPNSEKVLVDPVNWEDYRESMARNQYEVRWRARRIFKTRQECIDLFGEKIGSEIQLDYNPSVNNKHGEASRDGDADFLKQAIIWVVYDLSSKQVLWISKGYKDAPLKIEKDPLRLDDFYPCPIPLLATTTTDNTYPTPDFVIYERLADELDSVTKRLSAMVDCIRFVGITSSAFNKEAKNMLRLNDGELWPVDAYLAIQQAGGVATQMDWMPFDRCVEAIPHLMNQQQNLMTQIGNISRIPDIMQGQADPSTPVYSQQMKGKAMTLSIREPAEDVQRFARETISKMGEIMFEPGLFSDDTISLMCGFEQMLPDEKEGYFDALNLLRNDHLRTFRVDIETDSTIATDEEEDKSSRMEYIEAINALVTNIQNVMQFRPELVHPMIESAKFASRAFRTGRSLEATWSKALEEVEANDKAARENPAPPQPDYEQMKLQVEQAKADTENMKVQIMGQELQIKQAQQQFAQSFEPWLKSQELAQDGQKLEMEYTLGTEKIKIDGLKVQNEAQAQATEAELKKFQQTFTEFIETQKLELAKFETVLSEREKVLEEKRLAQEQELEVARMVHEKESRVSDGEGKGQPVNIHLTSDKGINLQQEHHHAAPVTITSKPKRKRHRIMRTPEGFVGESEDVEDEVTNG